LTGNLYFNVVLQNSRFPWERHLTVHAASKGDTVRRTTWKILLLLLIVILAADRTVEAFQVTDDGASPTKSDSISTAPRIFVKQFTFTGNSVVSSEELANLSRSFTGRELTIEQLEELRQVLIARYVLKGYINSGVIIPDQKILDGIVNLQVIEGRLNTITISGLGHFRESYFNSRLGKGANAPVNLNQLQQSLQLLQQDERIRKINAELQPGKNPGESELRLKIEEESPYKVTLRFNNDAAPSTGAYRGELALAHRNLLGFGDVLSADVGLTEGAFDFAAGYTVPLTRKDTSLGIYYRRNASEVIEENYKDIDITSHSETFGVKLRQPLYRTSVAEVALSAAGECRESRSWLLGRPFSFSPGEHDGLARVSVVRLGQELVLRDNRYLFALNSTFNIGVSALGSTINDSAPDSRFFSWLGQLVFLGKIGTTPHQVMFRTNTQLADSSLLPLERFGLGGMNSVRGYRSNLLVRDSGINSSLEFRITLLDDVQGWGVLQLVPFYDYGRGWNASGETPDPDRISAAGGGFRWTVRNLLLLEAYYGQSLTNVTIQDHTLADRGVSFQLTVEVF
jgi:hemolysin activation/secretion protein